MLFLCMVCDKLLDQKILPFDNHCLPTHREVINSLNHIKLLVHVIHACKKIAFFIEKNMQIWMCV